MNNKKLLAMTFLIMGAANAMDSLGALLPPPENPTHKGVAEYMKRYIPQRRSKSLNLEPLADSLSIQKSDSQLSQLSSSKASQLAVKSSDGQDQEKDDWEKSLLAKVKEHNQWYNHFLAVKAKLSQQDAYRAILQNNALQAQLNESQNQLNKSQNQLNESQKEEEHQQSSDMQARNERDCNNDVDLIKQMSNKMSNMNLND